MAKHMVTEDDVKKALAINSFRNISKDKSMEFVSAIPNMDKDIAIKIIEQFPAYTESANNMIAQLNTMCNNAMKENGESQKEVIEAYKKILDDLSELLKKDTITAEERIQITQQMITVADRISTKDTENKDFLNGIIKCEVSIIGCALFLGAAILGVNVKGTKIPTLK
jgi:predicted unusual protein kinase regulating ubiquinone biosynthesis (AarF/ABC1/UbiB family)